MRWNTAACKAEPTRQHLKTRRENTCSHLLNTVFVCLLPVCMLSFVRLFVFLDVQVFLRLKR